MFKYQIPTFFRLFYRGVTWRKSKYEKIIYLTFDDGCIPEVTPQVLAILDKYQLKATFFCVGENVSKYPDLYHSIVEKGHRTGCHTYNHLKGTKTPTDTYIQNVYKANSLIKSNLFRPPYGVMTVSQKRILQKDFEIILWDLITNDFDLSLSQEEIFSNIKRYSRNGSIVVFHDSIKTKENVLTILPQAIEFWKQKGYGFDVL